MISRDSRATVALALGESYIYPANRVEPPRRRTLLHREWKCRKIGLPSCGGRRLARGLVVRDPRAPELRSSRLDGTLVLTSGSANLDSPEKNRWWPA